MATPVKNESTSRYEGILPDVRGANNILTQIVLPLLKSNFSAAKDILALIDAVIASDQPNTYASLAKVTELVSGEDKDTLIEAVNKLSTSILFIKMTQPEDS